MTQTSPAYGATEVGVNVAPYVVFSEAINPITMGGSNFVLTHYYSGQRQPATLTVAADRRSATLTPLTPLHSHETYTLQLNSYTDIAGNSGAGTFVSFTTGSTTDQVAPIVTAISPAAGAGGVPRNARVVVQLSESIDPGRWCRDCPADAACPDVILSTDRRTVTFSRRAVDRSTVRCAG